MTRAKLLKYIAFVAIVLLTTVPLSGCDMIDEMSISLGNKAISTIEHIKDGISQAKLKASDKLDENEFIYDEPTVKETSTLVEPANTTDTIVLYLGDGVYYDLIVPEGIKYVTDNNTYVYAIDNSFNIQVASNVPYDDLSSYLTTKKYKHLQPDLIGVTESTKKVQEAIKYVANYKAVIIRCYDNQLVYSTLLQGLQENIYRVTAYSGMIKEAGTTRQLSTLSNMTGYHATITVGLQNKIQKIYNYDTGSLVIKREYNQFSKSVTENGTKLAIIAGSNVADTLYQTEDKVVITKGKYMLAVIKVNYNTTISLFATGDEAKFNLLTFVKEYEGEE